jgi:TatD DNase family protein
LHQKRMLDSHCHLDLYPEPPAVAERAAGAGVFTVAVTNLPSAFQAAYLHVAQYRKIRLALGLHPLLAEKHARERELFRCLLPKTSFIGEVGLDFSAEGQATAAEQIESFRFVLQALGETPRFVTVHSRRAESRVLELLRSARRTPVVFHWYTGPLRTLSEAVGDGHYFSVNPAMIISPNGRRIVSALPHDRILTETDGPFVKIRGRVAEPGDVVLVERGLSELWNSSEAEVRAQLDANFRVLITPLRTSS